MFIFAYMFLYIFLLLGLMCNKLIVSAQYILFCIRIEHSLNHCIANRTSGRHDPQSQFWRYVCINLYDLMLHQCEILTSIGVTDRWGWFSVFVSGITDGSLNTIIFHGMAIFTFIYVNHITRSGRWKSCQCCKGSITYSSLWIFVLNILFHSISLVVGF